MILIGTLNSASGAMLFDKGRHALSSSLRVMLTNKIARAPFSANAKPSLGTSVQDQISKSVYVCSRFIGSYLIKNEIKYQSKNTSVKCMLMQALYPLKHLHDIYTLEDLNLLQRNVDLYIQRMEMYSQGSWGYNVEKKRLEGCYLTSDLMCSGKRRELIEKYQNYTLSLIKRHGLELTTQQEITKLFGQTLRQLAFFQGEREKNFFRYCGINTHGWYNVQMSYPPRSLSLAYALCDPKMPQKYRIPESQFSAILTDCSLRINDQANYIMSKA